MPPGGAVASAQANYSAQEVVNPYLGATAPDPVGSADGSTGIDDAPPAYEDFMAQGQSKAD